MLDILFGWRKASKCKKLIKRVQCRLKLLKNKRCSILRQLREDVGQLLKIGREEIAFKRVEQLYKDECIMEVYELLDHFCEFIIIHLSYIRRHKDCPNDINEAVSSLIFASARFGDLPELRAIRELFGERYGQKFAVAAVELYPGNLVNHQVKEKLSIKSVSDDLKHRLVVEIFREYCLQPGPLALEYNSEWHQQQLQVKENYENQVLDTNAETYTGRNPGSQIQDSKNVKDIVVEAVYFNSASTSRKSLSEECFSLGSNEISSASTSSTALQSSVKEAEKIDNPAQLDSSLKFRIPALGTSPSSSEGSSHYPENNIVYLDDIEEFESCTKKDANCQDHRLFMFKSPIRSTIEKFKDNSSLVHVELQDLSTEVAGSRRSSEKNGKAVRKISRKRLLSREKLVSDIDCAIYYRPSPRRKHQKKNLTEGQEQYYAEKSVKQPSCNFKMVHNCSLEKPCYFCTNEAEDELEISPWKQRRSIASFSGNFQNDKPVNREMDRASLPEKPSRYNRNRGIKGDVLTCPYKHTGKLSKETERGDKVLDFSGSPVSSNSSSSRVTTPGGKIEMRSPYLRAVTMPVNRPKEIENIIRSNSFPFPPMKHLNHVHPKLPDYDELEAKFMVLKKEYLQNQH